MKGVDNRDDNRQKSSIEPSATLEATIRSSIVQFIIKPVEPSSANFDSKGSKVSVEDGGSQARTQSIVYALWSLRRRNKSTLWPSTVMQLRKVLKVMSITLRLRFHIQKQQSHSQYVSLESIPCDRHQRIVWRFVSILQFSLTNRSVDPKLQPNSRILLA